LPRRIAKAMRDLFGERYDDKLEGLLLDRLLCPHPQRVSMVYR
jgi:hypothetical protein